MRKIGINVGLGFDLDQIEMLRRIKAVGFDAAFLSWKEGCALAEWKAESDALGLEIPFIHAPFSKIEKIWEDDELGDVALQTQLRCVEDCAKNGLYTVVCHIYKGFDKEEIPTEIGFARLKTLLDRAQELGVRVAVENTEGDAYLDAVLERFWEHPALGFCIDSGHELCYNRGRDLITRYGDRLIATHLDDNLGISGESIFWHDDLHLLPWDGVVDFEGVAKRLQSVGFDGTLMFELTVKSKPNRHENDAYLAMGCDAYLQEAYRRAVRFAKLFD